MTSSDKPQKARFGIGGHAPAESPLRLRRGLALGTCIVLVIVGVICVVADSPVGATVSFVIAALALINAIVVTRRINSAGTAR